MLSATTKPREDAAPALHDPAAVVQDALDRLAGTTASASDLAALVRSSLATMQQLSVQLDKALEARQRMEQRVDFADTERALLAAQVAQLSHLLDVERTRSQRLAPADPAADAALHTDTSHRMVQLEQALKDRDAVIMDLRAQVVDLEYMVRQSHAQIQGLMHSNSRPPLGQSQRQQQQQQQQKQQQQQADVMPSGKVSAEGHTMDLAELDQPAFLRDEARRTGSIMHNLDSHVEKLEEELRRSS
ncbi:hypothetical protein BC831DRAFT_470585 [Entophlyctis helioformis]|nr:hypothetical protein BC831DRAFT_470585 [Entophlyctis helioformis]